MPPVYFPAPSGGSAEDFTAMADGSHSSCPITDDSHDSLGPQWDSGLYQWIIPFPVFMVHYC